MYTHLTSDQKTAISVDLDQASMLAIKCDQLHNPLLFWFTKFYNRKDRAFVIPGRGSIPVDEESVYLTMGLPRGPIEVPYHADYDIEADLAPDLFGDDGSRPKFSRVAELLVQYKQADNKFKRLWLAYITSTVLAPTMDTHISNKIYPMLVSCFPFYLFHIIS